MFEPVVLAYFCWLGSPHHAEVPVRIGVVLLSGQARSRAYALRLQAAGAKGALPEIEHSVSTAQRALNSADGAIRTAAIDVLVIEAEKHFSLLEELTPKINAAVLSLRGLRVLTAGWGKSSLFIGFDRSSSSLTIAERLAQLRFPEPKDLVRSLATSIPAIRDRDAIMEAEKQWLDMAKHLVSDPNAK
jgi:hypothetical protein